VAFDDDRAAAHSVARAVPDRTADHDDPATHARDFSRQRAAQSIACCSAYFKDTCLHAGGGPWSGIAEHRQPAAGHQAAGLDADITLDYELAAVHRLADIIEPIATTLNADLLNIACAYSKDICKVDRAMAGLQFHSFDLADRFAGKGVRHKRRQVETMIKSLAQGQCQRPHGSNSRK
jgi:hypothetical protein